MDTEDQPSAQPENQVVPANNTETPAVDKEVQTDNQETPAVDQETQADSQPATEAPSEPVAVENSNQTSQHLNSKKKLSRKKLITILAITLVVAGGALAWFLTSGDKEEKPAEPDTTTSENRTVEVVDKKVSEPVEDSDVLPADWFGTPRDIAKVSVFTDNALKNYYKDNAGPLYPDDLEKNVTYAQLGTSGGSRIITVTVAQEGLGTSYSSLVLIEDGQKYTLLKKHSQLFGEEDDKYYGPALSSTVKTSQDKQLDGFILQDNIEIQNALLERVGGSWYYGEQAYDSTSDPSDYTEVEETEYGTILEKIMGDGKDGVKSYYMLLKQPAGTYVQYRYVVGELKDDYSLAVDWNNGTSTNDKYRWDEAKGGCGFGYGVNVVAKQYHKDLVKRGKVGSKDVYEFSSDSHPILKKVYDAYATSNENKVSRAEYYKNHGVVVIKNELSYYVILANTKYVSAGECAKPVIYLYPEEPTYLHVSVDAFVTKSDPLYEDGWGVTAFPNGKLLHKGSEYRSLFWDGQGHGSYPEITSGFVVSRSNVEQTLTNHLKKFGLNNVEITDFLEYWMPLMPDTRYVRLTWFDTAMMNKLAPLHLTVSPDTLLRVFLDFEGLDNPVSLQPQKIYGRERRGFTVVEWGGLLRP